MGGLKRSASAACHPKPNRKITELFGKRPATTQAPPPSTPTPLPSFADTSTAPLPRLYSSELLFEDASETELQTVLNFCDATASTPSTALEFLGKNDGEVEVAFQDFLDNDSDQDNITKEEEGESAMLMP
jgi:hypothetical protein